MLAVCLVQTLSGRQRWQDGSSELGVHADVEEHNEQGVSLN